MPAGRFLLDVLAFVVGSLGLALACITLLRLRAMRAPCARCPRCGLAGGLTGGLTAGSAGPVGTAGGVAPATTGPRRGFRHAIVRYDAFPDTRGRLSFSLALLDDGGDGVVLTSISVRDEACMYAKGIRRGEGEQPLSPEEEEAIARAWAGAPVPARASA